MQTNPTSTFEAVTQPFPYSLSIHLKVHYTEQFICQWQISSIFQFKPIIINDITLIYTDVSLELKDGGEYEDGFFSSKGQAPSTPRKSTLFSSSRRIDHQDKVRQAS